jgi:hypothetical protein
MMLHPTVAAERHDQRMEDEMPAFDRTIRDGIASVVDLGATERKEHPMSTGPSHAATPSRTRRDVIKAGAAVIAAGIVGAEVSGHRAVAAALLQPPPFSLLESGTYTIRQKSNGRFVDAHESADQDFRLVTRPAQNNDTQRWLLGEVGANIFTIRQRSNGRFVDAHESADQDFRLVTRPAQNNDTQRWIFSPVGGVYTIRQRSNLRYVDAHESADQDFRLVTRPAQNNDTQRWVVLPAGGGGFTMRQLSTLRFVDAHESRDQDFRLVTRPRQNNDTQVWLFNQV